MPRVIKYLLAWFPMIIIAVINGTVREFGIRKFTNQFTAHQLSTFTLLILFTVYFRYIFRRLPLRTTVEALGVGLLWLILTEAFEFGLGLKNGRSWPEMLADYNILKGRLWLLIPAWVAIAPYVFFRLNEKRKH